MVEENHKIIIKNEDRIYIFQLRLFVNKVREKIGHMAFENTGTHKTLLHALLKEINMQEDEYKRTHGTEYPF